MRKLFSLVAGAALLVGTAASAAPAPFTASLNVQVGTLPGVITNGSGTGNTGPAGSGATIPANSFAIQATAPINPPLLSLIFGFAVGAPGMKGSPGGNFALNFGGVNGTMGLNLSAFLLNKKGSPVVGIPLN